MPLQNRVDPFGQIHAAAARGMFTGNRGVIHDPTTRRLLARRWTTKAWLICACDFRGRKRDVMGRNAPSGRAGWTELFFLDEVTALAAGHRPCFFCRRSRAQEFLGRFGDAFAIPEPKVGELDARLHAERKTSGGPVVIADGSTLGGLPDGALVVQEGVAFAIRQGHALPWSFTGYGAPRPVAALAAAPVQVVTPATTLSVLGAGYTPVWHASADPAFEGGESYSGPQLTV